MNGWTDVDEQYLYYWIWGNNMKNIFQLLLSITLICLLVGCSAPPVGEKHNEQSVLEHQAMPEESFDVEDVEPEPEPSPAPLAIYVPDGQVIIGQSWPPTGLEWEMAIDDPGDILLIEDFLRDLQPIEWNERDELSQRASSYIKLVLDGEPMKLQIPIIRHHLDVTSGRIPIFRHDRPEGAADTVDWRIWQVLLRHHDFNRMDISLVMPIRPASHPQQEVFTLGQVFEQSGVCFNSVQEIQMNWAGSGFDITDTIALEEIWGILYDIQLADKGMPDTSRPTDLTIIIRTADFMFNFEVFSAGIEFFPFRYSLNLAFAGEDGEQYIAQFHTFFNWLIYR